MLDRLAPHLATSLLLLGSPAIVHAAGHEEILVLRSSATSAPLFVAAPALNLLLTEANGASTKVQGLSAAEADRARRTLQELLRFLEGRRERPSLVDEEGCSRLIPDQFSQRKEYLLSADELVQAARLPLIELGWRAEHLVVVEVVEVMPGLLYSHLETVVRARVELVLSSRGDLLQVGDELLYRNQFVDLQLGDVRFCARNPDYFFPRHGARVLLLMPEPSNSLPLFNPYAEFELTDSTITVHPYPCVQLEPQSIPLEALAKGARR